MRPSSATHRLALLAAFGCATLAPGQAAKPAKHAATAKALAPAAPPAPFRSAALDAGEAAMEKKDFSLAERKLIEAAKDDPQDYRPWFDLGYVYNALGRKPEAIKAYRTSVALKPDVFESNLNLGLMLAAARDQSSSPTTAAPSHPAEDPEAEKYLFAATQLTPSARPQEGQERAWISLGRLAESRDPQKAIEYYRRAAELQPADADPHISLALLYQRTRDATRAEAEARAALAIDPHSADAASTLTALLLDQRRFPEAEKILRGQLASSSDALAHAQLAQVLRAQGQNDEAAAELQLAAAAGNNDPAVTRLIAENYLALGNSGAAIPLLRSLLTQSSADPELHAALGRALLRQHSLDEAEHELLAAIKLRPTAPEFYSDLAFVASEKKNYQGTLQALDARARYAPETPGTFFLRATAFDNLHDRPHAITMYHKFLTVASGKFPDQEFQARHRLIALEGKK